MKKLILSFFFLALFSVGLNAKSFAEDTAKPQASVESELKGLLPDRPTKEVVAAPVYQSLTYPNLYRLAWAMNAFDKKDDDVLDKYLMVTECSLYKKFYENEFEWEKVRKAAKKYLSQYGTSNKSTYYEFVQPLYLGRYDDKLQGFPVENPESYTALKVLQMANFSPGDTSCGKFSMDASKYPGSASLSIISPLTLTFISVDRDTAKSYLAWRADNKLSNKEGRAVFAKYRVRIDQFVDRRRMEGGYAFMFNGRLMQVDVYADKEYLMPLYSQIF